MIDKGDPYFAAAQLSLAKLYIGNDSGLMHVASAVKTPTIGLFGPSREEVYGPYGEKSAFVRSNLSFDEIVHQPHYDYLAPISWMKELPIEKVLDKIKELKKVWNLN